MPQLSLSLSLSHCPSFFFFAHLLGMMMLIFVPAIPRPEPKGFRLTQMTLFLRPPHLRRCSVLVLWCVLLFMQLLTESMPEKSRAFRPNWLGLRAGARTPSSCIYERARSHRLVLRGGQRDESLEDDAEVHGWPGQTADATRFFGHVAGIDATRAAIGAVESANIGNEEDVAGDQDPLANRQVGGIVSWGIGIHGRLGSGDWVDRLEPCQALEDLSGHLVQISAGDYHSLALHRNGSVLGFGSNGRCQLGDASKEHQSRAQMVGRGGDVELDEGFVKVAAGGLHSLALNIEGFVVAWGDNTTGQVGQIVSAFEDESYIRHHGWPIQVATPVIPRFLDDGVIDIAAGYMHSLALLRDGRILAWGCNIYGQLGTGKNLSFPPFDVEDEHDLSSRSDAFRRCKRDHMHSFENLPMMVRMPARASGVRAGAGSNRPRVMKIAAGGWHSLALVEFGDGAEGSTGGGVCAWGGNYLGQLGNGAFTSWDEFDSDVEENGDGEGGKPFADSVLQPKSRRAGAKNGMWADEGMGGTIQELEGAMEFMASSEDGDHKSVRRGAVGSESSESSDLLASPIAAKESLGGGGWNDVLTPMLSFSHQDLGPCAGSDERGVGSRVVEIAAGFSHSLALLANGSVLSWGSNQAGQLGVALRGTGRRDDSWIHPDTGCPFRPYPAIVALPAPAVAVAAGFTHSAAALADGRIFAWGGNYDAQLGRGSLQPCVPGERPSGVDCMILPGSHVPRQVGSESKFVGGAWQVALGSSHSLALVADEAFHLYPRRDQNASGQTKDWWPTLSDLLMEHDDPARGPAKPKAPDIEASVRAQGMLTSVRAQGMLTAADVEDKERGRSPLERPRYRHNVSVDELSRAAGCDMSAVALRVAGPEVLFEVTRTYFNDDLSLEATEILPNVRPILVRDPQWPKLKHLEWHWKNVTEAEARASNMPFPQLYRDGYGTRALAPEDAQRMLEEARRVYEKYGGDAIVPYSDQEQQARAETRELILGFYRQLCQRDADDAAEDSARMLAAGDYDAARMWSRKRRIALRRLVYFGGDPAVVEEGKKGVEDALLAIDRAVEQAELERIARHTQVQDRLYQTNSLFNATDQTWYQPDRQDAPIDSDDLMDDVDFGCMEVEVPVGEGVDDLKRRLCRMLREPPHALALFYNGTVLESDPPPGTPPLTMLDSPLARAWGDWGGTWQERDRQQLDYMEELDGLHSLRQDEQRWLQQLQEEHAGLHGNVSLSEVLAERRRARAVGGAGQDSHRVSINLPDTRGMGLPRGEAGRQGEKGRMTNNWRQGLHGWFRNEAEVLDVVSSSWAPWLFALRCGGKRYRGRVHRDLGGVRDFGEAGSSAGIVEMRAAEQQASSPAESGSGDEHGEATRAGVVGDVGGEWRAGGGFPDVLEVCRQRRPWECGCEIPLRIETLNPAFAFTEGTDVMHVRGYGFCNHSAWRVVFGDPVAKTGGREVVDTQEESHETLPDASLDSLSRAEGQTGAESDFPYSAMAADARVVSCRSLALRVPPHAAGNVTVRVYRDGLLVAEMMEAFEYIQDSEERLVDAGNTGVDVAMRIRLRHVAIPQDLRTELVMPLHLKLIANHRRHLKTFGAFALEGGSQGMGAFCDDHVQEPPKVAARGSPTGDNGTENASDAVLASALRLRAMYRELVHWDPSRRASLHNFGLFLEDVMHDRLSAEWLYKYGGFDVEEQEYVDLEEDSSSEKNFKEDLEHIPEELHETARADPRQIRWPWNDFIEDAPAGPYRKEHLCTDEKCPIPATIDPAKLVWKMRGCFNGPPVPDLPGNNFDD